MCAFDLSEPQEVFNDIHVQNTRMLLQRAFADVQLVIEAFAKARDDQLLIDRLIGEGLCREEAKALVKL